jgi:hypothetical protein
LLLSPSLSFRSNCPSFPSSLPNRLTAICNIVLAPASSASLLICVKTCLITHERACMAYDRHRTC